MGFRVRGDYARGTRMRAMRACLVVFVLSCSLLFFNGCKLNVRQRLYQGKESSWYSGVTAADRQHVWVVGNLGRIAFFDGSKWTPQVSGTPDALHAVSALDTDSVWAVGARGTVLYYNGLSWTSRASGTQNTLYDVAAVDSEHVWAVGSEGTILFYNGSGWIPQNTAVDWDLAGVAAADLNHVWAVGDGGVLFYDGSTWQKQWENAEGKPPLSLKCVSAVDSDHVWAAGNSVEQANPTVASILYYDGSGWEQQHRVPDCKLNAISAKKTVWAVTSTGLILSYDGEWEDSFIAPSYTRLEDICALENRAWAVGIRWSTPVIYSYDGEWARQSI